MNITFIGDVHGCYHTMMALLAQLPKTQNKIVFLGDLINKGPRSFEVYNFMRDHKYDCLVGNHELYCIHPVRYQENWQRQGGIQTDDSIRKEMLLTSGKALKVIRAEMSYYFERFLDYLIFPTSYGKFIIASHAGVSQEVFKASKGKVRSVLQGNPQDPSLYVFNKKTLAHIPNCIQVIGHQPKAFGPLQERDNFYADTGCVYKTRQGMGYLTALMFNLEKNANPRIFTQKNID